MQCRPARRVNEIWIFNILAYEQDNQLEEIPMLSLGNKFPLPIVALLIV